ncbi:MAG: DUF4386 domain-containing protein, partial [Candidatus Bathyarchaeia archaeon]
MNSYRNNARVAGVLLLFATAASLLSSPFLAPINTLNFAEFSANQNQALIGALLVFIAAILSVSIAISLYPVLKKFNQSLAIGAVSFRLIEAVLYIVGVVTIIFLLTLSQEFVQAGAPSSSYFQTLGAVFLSGHDWVSFGAGPIAFSLGALMYYHVFYQTKLVPRWLSGWGLIGAALCMVAGLLVMLGLIIPVSTIHIVLNLPIAVQEMVLAVWLIVKGFNPSV